MESIGAQLTQATTQMLGMFGLQASLFESTVLPALLSAEDITMLLSFTGGMRGNVAIGIQVEGGKQLVSAMMGGMEIDSIDEMAQSALGEFGNMLLGTVLNAVGSSETIHLSPPTLVIGREVMLIASRVKATRQVYTFNAGTLVIVFSVEQ